MPETNQTDNQAVNATIVNELEPVVASELDRHLNVAAEWNPSLLVPWSRGQDFPEDYRFDPNESGLNTAVRNVLVMNLLTEDNLPYYTESLLRIVASNGAWREWISRWTAEEGRHSIVIRDYLAVTNSVDLVELERLRMAQVSKGETPQPPNVAEALSYVAMQEEATALAHRKTGQVIEDPAGKKIMSQVAGDENLHATFYRNLVLAGMQILPSEFVIALHNQMRGFNMPSAGIPGFEGHEQDYVVSGVFDLEMVAEKVFEKVVGKLCLEQLEGLSAEAEIARDGIYKTIRQYKKLGQRLRQQANV